MNAIEGIDARLVTAGLGMCNACVGRLSTVIAAPVLIAELAYGVAIMADKYVSRRLLAKAKKQDEIRILDESKLNTINDNISKAFMDGKMG